MGVGSWINHYSLQIGTMKQVKQNRTASRFSRRSSSATTCHGYRLSGALREGHQTLETLMVRGAQIIVLKFNRAYDLLKK